MRYRMARDRTSLREHHVRVALYDRYLSDQQREASIEDQLRLCRSYAEKQGWVVAGSYQDRAVANAVEALVTSGLSESKRPIPTK